MAVVNVRERLSEARLYGILDMGYVSEDEMSQAAEDLLMGGVDVLQLRAKGYDTAGVSRLLREVVPGLQALCRSYEVPFIVNDFPEVASEFGVDGLHIGQDDGDLDSVRQIVGDTMIVGRSTHSPEQAETAVEEGFDYIGFGPLFPTPTKQGRPGIGLEDVERVHEGLPDGFPVFCIGGIVPANLELVLALGARRVVIVSALLMAKQRVSETKKVKKSILASE